MPFYAESIDFYIDQATTPLLASPNFTWITFPFMSDWIILVNDGVSDILLSFTERFAAVVNTHYALKAGEAYQTERKRTCIALCSVVAAEPYRLSVFKIPGQVGR